LGLLGSLGGGSGDVLGSSGFDDTDGDGLSHVTDSEATERRELGESLDAHGLRGDEFDDGGITRLDGLGVGLGSLTFIGRKKGLRKMC